MNKLLTIVVPVYKVEKYINKCLDSLVVPENQMKRLEVIIVNDGTPDNSAVMAKKYEEKYPDTFKVIDKENGGHGSAWNTGVELATGKYLRFLDSDDWLTNLSDFMDRLSKYDVDMVFTDKLEYYENKGTTKICRYSSAMEKDILYQVDNYDWEKTNLVLNGYNVTNFHTCTYRTEMLKVYHPLFLEKCYYDDEILFVLPLLSSKTFVYFDITLYNYLLGREGQSMDPNVMARNINYKIKNRQYTIEFYNKHSSNIPSVIKKIYSILDSRNIDTLRLMTSLPKKECISEINSMLIWLEEYYPNFCKTRMYRVCKKYPGLYWDAYHYIKPIWIKIRKK